MTRAITTRYVPLPDGRRLWVATAGAGPVVLLLHGGTCDHTDWLAQVPALSAEYSVIAPDLPFHGGSDGHPDGYSLDRHARDCLALLEALGVRRAVVVGHSMGAFVTRLLYGLAPERFHGVVIVDSRGALPQLLDLPRGHGVFDSQFNLRRMERFEQSKRALADRVGVDVLEHPPAAPADTWCRVPLLAFFASHGAACPDDLVQRVEASLSSATSRLVIVPDCGHWVMAEKPDLFNRELARFLADLAPIPV